MMLRVDIEALVLDQTGDTARLRDGAIDRAIDEAVRRYSKDRPRPITADIVGTGAHIMVAPVGWEPASRITAVEWPADRNPPPYRPAGDIVPYDGPSGPRLLVRTSPAPAPGETVRITFTASHRLSDTANTITDADTGAVAALAASLLLEQLAATVAGDTDPTIPADSVDHKSASDRYAARARAARKIYDDHLAADGAAPGAAPLAMADVALPGRPGLLRGRS